jgi:hypothetical protein
MADLDFEDDLRALFDAPAPMSDSDAFAAQVQARIGQALWLRAALVGGLGLVGALIAWLRLGLSLHDLARGLNAMTVATGGEEAYDSAVPWAAGLLLLGLGWLAIRPAISET